MDEKMRQRVLRNDRKKLEQKRHRLIELEQKYNAETGASKSSFKGKITRCKLDIESLEARIKRLSSTGF